MARRRLATRLGRPPKPGGTAFSGNKLQVYFDDAMADLIRQLAYHETESNQSMMVRLLVREALVERGEVE